MKLSKRLQEIFNCKHMVSPMKLSKRLQEIFNDCQMHCRVCMWDGGCELQKKYKREADKKIKQAKQ